MNETVTYLIHQWKQRYNKVFKVKIKNQEYIYRILTIGECEAINEFTANKDMEKAEEIAFSAVLYPENFTCDNVLSGISDRLYESILDSSHLFSMERLFNLIDFQRLDVAVKMKSDLYQWKLILLKIFTGYTLKDLNDLNPEEFFHLLVLAENITGQKLIEDDQVKEKIEKSEEVKMSDPKLDNVTKGDKFLPRSDLDKIAADQATDSLRKHWEENKTRTR